MPLRFMGRWMNSNNHCKVTDQTFATEICQRCKFDGKKEIPYWHRPFSMAIGNVKLVHECFPNTRAWEQQELNKINKEKNKLRRVAWVW